MKRDRQKESARQTDVLAKRQKTEGHREREKKSRRGKERLKDIQTDTQPEKLNERQRQVKPDIPIYRYRDRKQRNRRRNNEKEQQR